MWIKAKRVLSSIGFFFLLFIVLSYVINLLEHKESKIQYEQYFEQAEDIDVIFLGTSHMYNSVLPQVLWKEYGITSYNWGYSNCTVAENYYILQALLEVHKPEVVVLDLFGVYGYDELGNGKYRADRIEQQHVQFDSLPVSRITWDAAKDIFDDYDGNHDFVFNFVKYHNRWEELGEKDFDYRPSTEKGAQMLIGHQNMSDYVALFDSSYFIEQLGWTIDREVSSAVCYEYLHKLLAYCDVNDITLLCTFLPYPADSDEQMNAYVLGEDIAGYHCRFLNLVEPGYDVLNMTTDIYYDGQHLNYSGAYHTTQFLGQYLMENYGLEDHRNDPDYQYWNEDYESYVQFKMEQIRNTEDIYGKMMLLNGGDFSMTFIENIDCNVTEEDPVLRSFMEEMQDHIVYYKDALDCDYRIIIYRTDTGEVVEDCNFTG